MTLIYVYSSIVIIQASGLSICNVLHRSKQTGKTALTPARILGRTEKAFVMKALVWRWRRVKNFVVFLHTGEF